MCSVAGHVWPSGLDFLCQRFSSLVRNEACQFRNQQSRTAVKWRPWFYLGLVAHSFFWLSERALGSRVRLRARSTQRLTNQLRLALEPECLENPTATAREDPRDGADSIRDTQAVCGFRYWASKHTPFFHTISTIVAIFLAKVSRAVSGFMPLATRAA